MKLITTATAAALVFDFGFGVMLKDGEKPVLQYGTVALEGGNEVVGLANIKKAFEDARFDAAATPNTKNAVLSKFAKQIKKDDFGFDIMRQYLMDKDYLVIIRQAYRELRIAVCEAADIFMPYIVEKSVVLNMVRYGKNPVYVSNYILKRMEGKRAVLAELKDGLEIEVNAADLQ